MSLISFLWSVDQIRYHRMRCLHLQFAKSLDQDNRSNLFVWSGLIWFQLVYANSVAPDQKYTMWGLMKVSTIRMLTGLDPDLARHFAWPDLGSTFLQRLQAENTSRQP